MKTIKRKYNTYDFSELNESAKERVRQWYLDDDMRSSDWENEIEQDLMIMFPNSDLHIQFSLNSCQGDGVNIYGELIPEDLVKVKDFYGDLDVLKNIEPFELPEELRGKFHFELKKNARYSYCVARCMEEVFDDDANVSDEEIKICRKHAVTVIEALCQFYEKQGYDYMYTASDEEIQATCDANEWRFLENGEFFIEKPEDEEECPDVSFGLYVVEYVPTSTKFLVKAWNEKDAIALAIPANKQVGEMEEEDLEDEKDYKAVPADFTAIRELFSECSRDCSYWGGDDKVVIFDI